MIDGSQLSRIWSQCSDRLLLIARSVGEPAEDAVQEAFLKLAEQSTIPADPMAWLVVMTRNQLIDWQRKSSRQKKLVKSQTEASNWFLESSVEIAFDAETVTKKMQMLPEIERQIIAMHLWGELSFEQIGKIVAMSRSSAHRAYTQGIERLQSSLK